jgi:YD repeat-containing protein
MLVRSRTASTRAARQRLRADPSCVVSTLPSASVLDFESVAFARGAVCATAVCRFNRSEAPLPTGIVVLERRDAADRITQRRDRNAAWTHWTYDGYGRLSSISDGAQTTSQTRYDQRHRPVAKIVTQGATGTSPVDVLGSSAVVPLSGSVPGGLYAPPSSSPPSGQLIPSSLAHVEGLLAAAFTTHGSDGRVAGVTSYAMGPAGLETASDEQYEHDLSTRTATRIVHTTSGNVRWEQRWDGLGRLVSSTNDLDHALTVTYPSPTSRVLTQRGPDGSNIVTTAHLNDFGGVLQKVDRQNNVLVDRITDAWGRTTQETGAGGDQVDVTYDAWSRVESVSQHAADHGGCFERIRRRRPSTTAGAVHLRSPRAAAASD